jgi:four helix bundle protein
VTRSEELIAWQKARALTREVYRITRPGAFTRDFGLAGQMQRAAASIMSNIAEGFERVRAGKFHPFLSAAKASCAGLRSHLYAALDAGHISTAEFHPLMAAAKATARLVGALRTITERRRHQHVARTVVSSRDGARGTQHPPQGECRHA